jgi:hypothetical protein
MRSKQRAASIGVPFDFPGLVFRPRPNRRFIISSPFGIIPFGDPRVVRRSGGRWLSQP